MLPAAPAGSGAGPAPYAGGVEYLSPAWLDAAAALVAADPGLAAAARAHRLVVEYTVEAPAGSPDGAVTYHLRLADGAAALVVGGAPDADVRFRCDRTTAAAVATGALGAQRAFMEGRLRIGGDVRTIVEAQAALAGLTDVLAAIRPGRTG
jgi:hypothetical protein